MKVQDCWTIPIEGIMYVCWKDAIGSIQHRQMTVEEENEYNDSLDQDRTLRKILRRS